jgi:quercetin dioxygenase-like cupin family protein
MPSKFITHVKDMKWTVTTPGLAKNLPEYDPQQMSVSQWTVEKGAETKIHVHDEAEMAYVVKGKARLTIEDNPPEIVVQGDFFYTAPGSKHGMKVIEDLQLVLFSMPKAAKHTNAGGKPHSH